MKSLDESNYYDLLAISQDASKIAIQEAYHSTCYLFDQDSIVSYNFLSDPERETLLNRLRKAYETLMDEQKRIEYDKEHFHRVGNWYTVRTEKSPDIEDRPEEKKGKAFCTEIRLHDYLGEDGLLSLRALREARGINVEEISRVTRIRVPMIMALENRDVKKLPPAIYVKGYLTSYANTLGIKPEKLLLAYGLLRPTSS
jgi:hypothetical protein